MLDYPNGFEKAQLMEIGAVNARKGDLVWNECTYACVSAYRDVPPPSSPFLGSVLLEGRLG